ncbi:MAG: 4-hydroxybenzoate octaprenyltransferase [Pseudomonadales bacterium]|nr:4-hydroxybenzoate octaprenyltransferase [Pseudomonadales bacterium]NRA15877.1 4-hydroxybenzoate octaprenyltransferase [Oceanospirillaceae bacterium]
MTLKNRLNIYITLTRFDKPIGSYLLLWPTLWALWIASDGNPDLTLIIVFTLGVFLTRSAGCVINDVADRKIDGKVKRTANRPLAKGLISTKEAVALFILLMGSAFLLVLLTTNSMTVYLSFIALGLALLYPFMKRYTQLPQLVLGAAFGFGIPMAFTATGEQLPLLAWLLYFAKIFWTIAYDTMYAMVDRDDDLKIGVKSTAILFGQQDRLINGILQMLTLALLICVGLIANLGSIYYLGLLGMACLFVYQQYLIKDRDRDLCFKAFLNNHYAGLLVFIAIVLDYLSR